MKMISLKTVPTLLLTLLLALSTSAEKEAEAPVQEEQKEGKKGKREQKRGVEVHRELLEKVHAEEMKRLEQMKAVAEDRDRDDMKQEADERIEEAKKRHQAALQQLDRADVKEPEDRSRRRH